MKRWLKVIGITLFGPVMLLFFFGHHWLESRSLSHRFSKLREGITRPEVYEVMGFPPGTYGDPRHTQANFYCIGFVNIDPRLWPVIKRTDCWVNDEGVFYAAFDGNDRLAHRQSQLAKPRSRSLWRQFDDWLFRLVYPDRR